MNFKNESTRTYTNNKIQMYHGPNILKLNVDRAGNHSYVLRKCILKYKSYFEDDSLISANHLSHMEDKQKT